MELEIGSEIKRVETNRYVHQLPGRTTYSDFKVLKRGIVPKSSPIFNWCQKTIAGNFNQKDRTKLVTVKTFKEKTTSVNKLEF